MNYYNNYLYHYGIKGQKWGVRRFQDKNGRLTNSGKERYSEDSSKQRKGLSDKQKKYIKIGAAVVATALVAYGTYKIADRGSFAKLATKGKAALNKSGEYFNRNDSLANKDMTPDGIFDTVVKRINPDYGGIGTKNNCRRCTFAYEMSRRGFDVKATKTIDGTGQGGLSLFNATASDKKTGLSGYIKRIINDDPFADNMLKTSFLGERGIKKVEGSYSKSIFNALSGYENGARGELCVGWTVGGRHSMAWEIVKGKPVIFDCQTGTKYDTPDLLEDLSEYISEAGVTRLDNVSMNTDFLLRWLTNA